MVGALRWARHGFRRRGLTGQGGYSLPEITFFHSAFSTCCFAFCMIDDLFFVLLFPPFFLQWDRWPLRLLMRWVITLGWNMTTVSYFCQSQSIQVWYARVKSEFVKIYFSSFTELGRCTKKSVSNFVFYKSY